MIVAAMAPNIESNSRGSMPRIVVPEARATGTMRLRAAATSAAAGSVPVRRSSPMRSTSTTAFFTFMPTRPSRPSSEKKLKTLPVTASPSTTPMKTSGIISRMTAGSR